MWWVSKIFNQTPYGTQKQLSKCVVKCNLDNLQKTRWGGGLGVMICGLRLVVMAYPSMRVYALHTRVQTP
jgi:hypothetical protein